MTVYCYPVPEKPRALNICIKFARGCNGQVVTDLRYRPDGPAFFFGVTKPLEHIYRAAKASPHGFLYADNSYFDFARRTHMRVTWNALQHSGKGKSDMKRFRVAGGKLHPWREPAETDYIIMCPQSDTFMQMPVGYAGSGDWTTDARNRIRAASKRVVLLRPWNAAKKHMMLTLPASLQTAYATVAWSSAALVTSVLHGVPIISEGDSAASPMSSTYRDLMEETMRRPEREPWAGILADNQWTLDEFSSGFAWRMLQEHKA